jgi:hypothetical protein
MSTVATIPRIENVTEIKNKVREPILVHFTEEQWEVALKGLKKVDELGTSHSIIEFTQMPGGKGAVLAAAFSCPQGTSPYVYTIVTEGPSGPQNHVVFTCYGDGPRLDCQIGFQYNGREGSGIKRFEGSFVCLHPNGTPCPEGKIAYVASVSGAGRLACVAR